MYTNLEIYAVQSISQKLVLTRKCVKLTATTSTTENEQ